MDRHLIPQIILLLVALPAAAAQWSIEADGSGDFATIQAAIDAAAPADEIILEDGLFQGLGNCDLQFNGKDLVVRSRNGAANCTIDSQGTSGNPHRAFLLNSGETQASVIDGITITGGFAEGVFPNSGGGGILVAYGSHPTIMNCVFEGNETGFQGFGGGLLAWEDCDITLTDCTFTNNVSGWYGGGFVLRKNCDALVERCLVMGNYSLHAGGGASITRSNAVLNDCVFADNETTEVDGGGVLVKAEAMPTFNRCLFVGNRAWAGGGLGLGNCPTVTVNDCLFENNTAVNRGGAICLDQEPSTVLLTGCTIVHNRAPVWGGHIYSGGQANTVVRNSIFGSYCDNTNAFFIGASGSLDIDCSLIQGGAGEFLGSGTLIYGASNIDADPIFCGADPDTCDAAPYPPGDYSLDSLSPAAPSWNSCGLLGAFPVLCGTTSASEFLEPRSWGIIKAAYR